MPLPTLIDDTEASLTERVYETLKTAILSLDLKPREHLIIGDLAGHYQISRTPVREALIMLEREGWVKNDGRRGAMVTVPSAEAIMQTIEIQAVLEGYIAQRATELATTKQLSAIEALLDEADTMIEAGDEEGSRQVGLRFHELLAEMAGNPRMRAEIALLEQHVARVRPLIWQKGAAPADESARQHRAIFNAMRRRNAERARQLMFDHTVWFEKELSTALRHV
jgi:DNA-binding GntR family transcriptional regulator